VTLTEKQQLDLFYEMFRIRSIEEMIANRYSEQKMRCPVHLSIGQEAVAVGVSKALSTDDYMISNHRAHAHYLAKGGNLNKMIAEIYGKKTGCSQGRGGSMHLIDLHVGIYGTTPIVASSIPVGVGLAFASQMKNEERLTLIYLGEGATEEGVFAECLNFASLKNLPILFVCENNLYSVYSPLSVRQSENRNRVEIAKAHGLYTDSGDGMDVEKTYAIAEKAVHHIRNGNGTAFIELDTYRYKEHCGPNNDTNLGYRSEEEVKKWEDRCPIALYKEKIEKSSLLTPEIYEAMRMKLNAEIDYAFSFARESAFPTYDPDYEKMYAR